MSNEAINNDANEAFEYYNDIDALAEMITKTESDDENLSDLVDKNTEVSDDLEDDHEDLSDDEVDDDSENDHEVSTIDEDHELEIKVGDNVEKVKIKDLKRLYGQEVAINQKNMEIAATRKKLGSYLEHVEVASELMFNRAMEDYKQYESLDWVTLFHELPPEQFKVLHAERQKAENNVKFFKEEFNKSIQIRQDITAKERIEIGKQTISKLTNTETGLKGFDEKSYQEAVQHAVYKLGAPAEVAVNIVEDWAVEAMYKAYLYDMGKGVKTSVVERKPKKIVKTTSNSNSERNFTSNANVKAAKTKFSNEMDFDSAAEFLTALEKSDR